MTGRRRMLLFEVSEAERVNIFNILILAKSGAKDA